MSPSMTRAWAAALSVAVHAGIVSCTPGAPSFEEVNLPLEQVHLDGTGSLDGAPLVISARPQDADRPHLEGIWGGRLLPEGGVALANEASTSVVLFDEEGRFEGEVGGPGEEPGRMRRIHAVELLGGDSMLVLDRALQRITVMSRDGAPGTVVEIPDRGGLPPSDIHLLGSGHVAVVHRELPRTHPRGFSREEVLIQIQGVDGRELELIGPVPGRELYGESRANLLVPYGHRFLAAASGRGLVLASGRTGEIVEYDSEGTATGRLELPVSRMEITADAREEVLARYRRPTTSDEWMSALGAAFHADSFPAFDRMVATEHGTVWIRLHSGLEPPTEWVVLDVPARSARSFTLPGGAEVLDATDERALMIVEDESGVPEVRVYDVEVES